MPDFSIPGIPTRKKAGSVWKGGSRFVFFSVALVPILTILSCALTATRPVQDMSDTTAAIRAAKEVQADTLAPELYRQANEWFFKARKEYKFKNFSFALEYAKRARKFAEQAEYEALRNGGNRTDSSPVDQAAAPPPAAAAPYAYPGPQSTPADVYEQRKAEDEAKKAAEKAAELKAQAQPQPTPSEPIVIKPPTFAFPTAPPGTPAIPTPVQT